MNFKREIDLRKNGKCPFCEKKIDKTEFRDKESYKEYKISGLCQTCQDKFFENW